MPVALCDATTNHWAPAAHLCGAERGNLRSLAQGPAVRQMTRQIWVLHLSHPNVAVTVRGFKPVTSGSQTRLLDHWNDYNSMFLIKWCKGGYCCQIRRMWGTSIKTVHKRIFSCTPQIGAVRPISGNVSFRVKHNKNTPLLFKVAHYRKNETFLKIPTKLILADKFYKWFLSIILQNLRQLNKKTTF